MKTATNWNKTSSFPLLYYLIYFIFFLYLIFVIIQHLIISSSFRHTSLQQKIKKIIYGKVLWKQQSNKNSYVIFINNNQRFFFIVSDDVYDELMLGDYILAETEQRDISFRNSYEFYLYSSFGVNKYGYIEKVLKIVRSRNVINKVINNIFFGIYKLRKGLVELVNTNVNQPYNNVILRLSLGYKDTELDEIYRYFQDAGVAHVLVVSGLHVGFIYTFLYFVLKLFVFDKSIRIICVSLLTIFFMLLTGCSPPVVRSTIIVLSFGISELLARKQDPIHSLILAAFVILLINPSNLFSVSFQLSFAACFGIVYFYPLFYSYLRNFVEKKPFYVGYIIKLFLVTTSAQIATIPFLVYYFNKFSIISFLSNIFVIPITSMLLWISMFGYITSFFSKLCFVVLKIAELLTFLYVNLIKFFSQIPHCIINVGRINILSMIIYYFIFVILIPLLLNKNRYKTSMFAMMLAILLLFINFNFDKNLRITFLDVGLGDCIFVKTEDNKNILIDTGDSVQTVMYKISPWLKEKGVFTIHHLVITHPHYPHYGGTEFLIDNFKIEKIYINELIPPDNFEYKMLIDKIKQKNIKLYFVDKIKTIKFPKTEVVFIPNHINYFYNGERFYDHNSILVKIKHKNLEVLLTNDIPLRYLNKNIFDKNKLFLQLPNHGKYKEDITELKNLSVKPKFLIVSTDKYIPEIKTVLKIPVFTTVDDGNITIDVKETKLKSIDRTSYGIIIRI